MTAWHGSQELKDRIVARMHQHRKDDAFVQGVYQQLDVDLPLGYRGCAIGCLLDKQTNNPASHNSSWHREVERQFGIPRDVAGIIDDLFEYHTTGADHHARASDFAVAVVEAIPVGADLSSVPALYDAWEDDFVAPYDPNAPQESDRADEDQRVAKLIELLAAAPAAVSDVDGAGGGGQL